MDFIQEAKKCYMMNQFLKVIFVLILLLLVPACMVCSFREVSCNFILSFIIIHIENLQKVHRTREQNLQSQPRSDVEHDTKTKYVTVYLHY